jgi:hypothetical protein
VTSMDGAATAWYHDPATVAALAQETASISRAFTGSGAALRRASRQPHAPGRRSWMDAYAEAPRFWFLPIEHAALMSALCQGDAPQFQNRQAQTRMQAWWSDVTRDDVEDRSRAARLARVVAEAWDASTNHPAPLNRHRVCRLHTDRYRINRFYAGLARRFETPPPISWLPVIPDHHDGYITMRHARWPRSASVKFLTAFLGADEEVIRQFVGRRGGGKSVAGASRCARSGDSLSAHSF